MTYVRKNVLWLIKGLGSGGAENLLVSAARHVDRDRFNYSAAYFLPWKNALVEDLEEAGVPVLCLNQSKPYDIRAVFALNRKMRKDHIDLLHAHLPYSGIVGRLSSRFTPVNTIVYTEHNVWERYHRLTYMANKATFKWNDAVIAVSESVEQSIRSRMKVKERPQLGTIDNGVDVEALGQLSKDPRWLKAELGIPEENRIVVNVANFTPKKRHIDLLTAAKRVVGVLPATSFVLVGQGPLLEETKAAAIKMGLQDTVFFAGFRDDAREIIAAGDMFVLSSQFEGMPVSVLEAMATRTPVLSTNVGGLPEMIDDGKDGVLVEPGAPDKLAESIIATLQDESLRASIANLACCKAKEHYDIKHMVRKTEALYTKLLEGQTK